MAWFINIQMYSEDFFFRNLVLLQTSQKKPLDHTCQNSRMDSGYVQGQKVPEESFGYK